MAFKDIVGNERIKKVLRLSLQKERMPHALLFCGPEGVGKRAMALVLAKALSCERLSDDACEECAACRAINEGRFPDVLFVPKTRETISIEDTREMKNLAHLKPMIGAHRVFIIDEAEKMSPDAANSILKILEEPPPFTYIFLLTAYPDLILPTITSRCRVLPFSSISQADIERCLRERGLGDEQARILSILVRGNLEQALEADWEEIVAQRQAAWDHFRALLGGENSSAFLEEFGFQRRAVVEEDLSLVLEMFSTFGRDLVLLKEGGGPAQLMNPDYGASLREFSSSVSVDQVLRLLSRVEAALAGLDKSLNIGLLVSTFYSGIIRGRHE